MNDPLSRLDVLSDRLSPVVVKEVRQFVRSREFVASFATSLLIALLIAFFGSMQALAGSRAAGQWTFTTLTACLALLGLAVVPLGAFTTLRTERLEQTLELISLTTMSPRRIVVGKLAAQAVKLVTFFAVMMPFIATSFLLGGVDFVTILTTMVTVFLMSLWVAAAALFASTMFRSRLLSGLAFGVIAVVVFIGYNASPMLFLAFRFGSPAAVFAGASASATGRWWAYAAMVVFCLVTMMNLVLLAESRLALPTENRASVLRLGFLVQFLLIVAWPLRWMFQSATFTTQSLQALTVFGGLHLALIAAFAVTEGLALPDPRVAPPSWLRRWKWLQPVFGPGGSRAALYVLLQMALFVAAGALLSATASEVRLLIALCGAICLFTGVPSLLVHRFSSRGLGALHARGMMLILLMLSLVLPDILYYIFWRPEVFSVQFSARHLFSPVIPLFNWDSVLTNRWELPPMMWAVVGILSYVRMMRVSAAGVREAEPLTTLRILPESDAGDTHSR